MRSRLRSALAAAALALPLLAQAAEIDGSRLAAWWGIPFAGALLSIAILPLAAPKVWHHHFGKVTIMAAGSVFMGANTYIGNAPNFMVKAIAEDRGIRMPSFFGCMDWSGAVLLPLFVIITFIWFR